MGQLESFMLVYHHHQKEPNSLVCCSLKANIYGSLRRIALANRRGRTGAGVPKGGRTDLIGLASLKPCPAPHSRPPCNSPFDHVLPPSQHHCVDGGAFHPSIPLPLYVPEQWQPTLECTRRRILHPPSPIASGGYRRHPNGRSVDSLAPSLHRRRKTWLL
jgi:hypothetical protein